MMGENIEVRGHSELIGGGHCPLVPSHEAASGSTARTLHCS